MANKWRTTVLEANAVFVNYGVHPSDLSTEALTRKWTGIDRSVLYSLITTLRATATVTGPKADGVAYSGVWTVDSVDHVLDEGGNLAGSATIIQVLKKNVYALASPDNLTIVRSRAYPLEQNENAWMYYERYKSEVTKRWHNISAANIEAEYEKLRDIVFFTSTNHELDTDGDLYVVGYSKTAVVVNGDGSPAMWAHVTSDKTYWEPTLNSVGGWHIIDLVEIENPIIRECWYEQNADGTYNLFRTLEVTNSTAVMRTRALQYAGMTLTNELAPPMEGDTTIYISGLNNLTETIYKNSRFRIGSDTYRVTADTVASGGNVTVPVSPEVSASTETTCYTIDVSPVQIFWDAL